MTHIPSPARHPDRFVEECGLRPLEQFAELVKGTRCEGTPKWLLPLLKESRREDLLAAAKANCTGCLHGWPLHKGRTPLAHQYGRDRPACKARGVWKLIAALDGEQKCTD